MISFSIALFIFFPILASSDRQHRWQSWKKTTEEARNLEYRKRYDWPENRTYVPNTPGWKNLFDRRFHQARHIQNNGWKYDSFVQTTAAAYAQPNFTENGSGLTKASDELLEALQAGIREGLADENKVRMEGNVDVIDGETPWFINRPDLTERAMNELKPIHEAWSHQKLVPYRAYGFRLYRNQSSLLMHIDKSNTHIISCILHIDSSDDAEPWPIVIEDLQGNTNEVILKPGDMLLYESSKCFHGRPQRFNGSWYSSVFIHYYPDTDDWREVNHEYEIHYSIALDWYMLPDGPSDYPELEMRGTSMREPQCEHGWCALKDAIHWKGPAEEDFVLTTGGKRTHLWGGIDEDEEDELKEEL